MSRTLRAGSGCTATSRRSSVVVRAQAAALPRRAALSALLASAAAAAGAAAPRCALARDYKEALAEKEARRKQLRETAGDIKNSGKDKQVFKDSDYAMSEDARTPNALSRQNEGARTQVNV